MFEWRAKGRMRPDDVNPHFLRMLESTFFFAWCGSFSASIVCIPRRDECIQLPSKGKLTQGPSFVDHNEFLNVCNVSVCVFVVMQIHKKNALKGPHKRCKHGMSFCNNKDILFSKLPKRYMDKDFVLLVTMMLKGLQLHINVVYTYVFCDY